MGLGPPTPHENGLAYAGRGSGNVALSWYARVRNESDVGAFGTPHCRIRARRAESCTREAPPGRGQTSPGGSVMDQLIERCCGLDVHRDTVAACVRVPGPNGKQRHEVQTFGTTAGELLALRDWLEAHGVTHVAMESTGVYWKPVFYVLEEAFTCLLANAAHIAQVPGRKTDVQDCQWIAQLLEHGLIRGSFVPPAPIRELRDLTRYRKALIQDRTREANRLHMKPETISAGVVAGVGAALSSLCCLLPLAVIALGLGSGAFMAVTMQYRWLLIPTGILGVVAGFALYIRERRRCEALACRMAGSRTTLALLVLASLVVVMAIVLDRFPEATSDLLARLSHASGHGAAGHDMKNMGGR